MPSNYTKDCNVCGVIDLDDEYVTEKWLVDRYVTGNVYSAGFNSYGQIGNGIQSATNYSIPVQVTNNNFLTVCACNNTAFAIKNNGTLWAWGDNTSGIIPPSANIRYSSPVQIGSLTDWTNISGTSNTIFSIKNGTLWGWGLNNYGQLGNGTTISYSSPIQIGSITNWKQVYSSQYTLAIKTDGTLWGWGYNPNGQLGNGTIISYSSPVQIGTLNNWKKVGGSCAIKTDGTLWTWGYSYYGRIGNGTQYLHYSSPIQVGSQTDWKELVDTGTVIYAIKNNGTLWAWGGNDGLNYYLGNGNNIPYSSPIQIGSSANWKTISAHSFNILTTKTDGSMWGWGRNSEGNLMTGTTAANVLSPVQAMYGNVWQKVSAGNIFSLAMKTTDIMG